MTAPHRASNQERQARAPETGLHNDADAQGMTGQQLLEVLHPAELVALVEALRQQGKAICAKERFPDHHVVPSERDVEILRLRLVEGATHEATARAVGLSKERIRQILASHFGIYGTTRGPRRPGQAADS
jgi:hypothetical protein